MPESRMALQAAIRRASFAAQQSVIELDREQLDELARLYEAVTGDIVGAIDARGGGDGRVDVSDMHGLLQEIYAHLERLAAERAGLLNAGLQRAAELGGSPFASALGAQLVGRMSAQAVQFVREFQAADGLRLSDRIWRLDQAAREAVQSAVQNSVVRGHGAAQAAREFLSRGAPVPAETALAVQGGTSRVIGGKVQDALLTGERNALSNAMRVFRTEINRAHGTAYQLSAEQHPDAVGTRFMLSPRHPRVDICDMHARANLYGLGPGVYPHGKNPWPAHPNTLSFVIVVFKDEVTTTDAAGRQTVEQFLESVPAAQRQGILGKNKNEAFESGDLPNFMVGSRWKDVRARLARRATPPVE